MSRITQHIRLVLISSSLVFHGCEQQGTLAPSCEQRPPQGDPANPQKQGDLPSACGPARSYHRSGHYFWGWGSGGSSNLGGKSGAVSSGRGGFGSSAHGVSS